jgi:hypothetical protein
MIEAKLLLIVFTHGDEKISLTFFLTTFSHLHKMMQKTCVLLTKITTLIQSEHIQPKPIDDSLSVLCLIPLSMR